MKIILNGSEGRMGKEIISLSEEKNGFTVAAKADRKSKNGYRSLTDIKEDGDCIIDFSCHSAVCEVCSFACIRGIPLVIGTTGHTENERALILKASDVIPVFYSSNMCPVMCLVESFAKNASVLMPNALAGITEVHHSRKKDSPSATALTLKNAVEARSGRRDTPIMSVRLGDCAGTHEISFTDENEAVLIKHEIKSRRAYAEGALTAAEFTVKQKPGLYSMYDIIFPGKGDLI